MNSSHQRENEGSFYVIEDLFSKVKGHHCQIVTFRFKTQEGHLSMSSDVWWKKATALGKDLWPRISWKREIPTKDFQATESPCKKKCATEHGGPRYWMFLFLCEKWDSVPQFRDECSHYMTSCILKQQQIHFGGAGWI